jgi:hypothetical protein
VRSSSGRAISAATCRRCYKQNGVVFDCMLVRMLLFSEARFMFREIRDGASRLSN